MALSLALHTRSESRLGLRPQHSYPQGAHRYPKGGPRSATQAQAWRCEAARSRPCGWEVQDRWPQNVQFARGHWWREERAGAIHSAGMVGIGDGDLICAGHSPAPFPLLHRRWSPPWTQSAPRPPNSWRQPRGACLTAGTAQALSCHRRTAGNRPAPPVRSPGQTRRPNRHANGPQRSYLSSSATLSDTQAQQERAPTRRYLYRWLGRLRCS